MTIDYVKLAEKVGSSLNELGQKATAVAVKGVVADAWATFIPSVLMFVFCCLAARFAYMEYNDTRNDEWVFGAFIALAGIVFSGSFLVSSLHGVILASMSPEWAAMKALMSAVGK